MTKEARLLLLKKAHWLRVRGVTACPAGAAETSHGAHRFSASKLARHKGSRMMQVALHMNQHPHDEAGTAIPIARRLWREA